MSIMNPGTDPNMMPPGSPSPAQQAASPAAVSPSSSAPAPSDPSSGTSSPSAPNPNFGVPAASAAPGGGSVPGTEANGTLPSNQTAGTNTNSPASTSTTTSGPQGFGNDGAQGGSSSGTSSGGSDDPFNQLDTQYWQPDGSQNVMGVVSPIYKQIKALPSGGTAGLDAQDAAEYADQFGLTGSLSSAQQQAALTAAAGTNNAGEMTLYADGGAIGDDDDTDSGSVDPNANAMQAQINKALGTVDSVLQFGRKLHGLSGGDEEDDGAIRGTQVAQGGYLNGRMPAIPGNQSESGRPPLQPMPGPLPPTSNPFGKRVADAGDSSSDEDSSGAIDTEETA